MSEDRTESQDPSPPPATPRWVQATLVALLLLACAPYRAVLDQWPHSRDAATWIARGNLPATGWDEWVDWVFHSSHFVAFRPVTAMSYGANGLLAGDSIRAFRLVDLGLHALCAVLVFVLFRRLAPRAPAWGGLIAAGLFALHPVGTEVVPHLARRSYSLGTALSLSALVWLAREAGSPWAFARRATLGTLLLLLAFGANEITFAAGGAAVLVAAHVTARAGLRWHARSTVVLVGVALSAGLMLWARGRVLQGIGGYREEEGALEVLTATTRTLAGHVSEGNPGAPSSTLLVLAAIFGAYLLTFGLLRPMLRASEPESRARCVAALWCLGSIGLIAPLGVWFPREVYPLVVPFALVLALLFVDAGRGVLPGPRWVHLGAVGLVIGSVLGRSPLVSGLDPGRLAAWERQDSLLRDLQATLREVPDGASVELVVPFFARPKVAALKSDRKANKPPPGAEQPAIWTRHLLRDRDLELSTWLVFSHSTQGDESPPALVDGKRVRVEFAAGARYWELSTVGKVHRAPGGHTVTLKPRRRKEASPRFVYFHDGARSKLAPVPP